MQNKLLSIGGKVEKDCFTNLKMREINDIENLLDNFLVPNLEYCLAFQSSAVGA